MLRNHGVELKRCNLGWMGQPLLQEVISLPDISKLSQHSARQCSRYDPKVIHSFTSVLIILKQCLICTYSYSSMLVSTSAIHVHVSYPSMQIEEVVF